MASSLSLFVSLDSFDIPQQMHLYVYIPKGAEELSPKCSAGAADAAPTSIAPEGLPM